MKRPLLLGVLVIAVVSIVCGYAVVTKRPAVVEDASEIENAWIAKERPPLTEREHRERYKVAPPRHYIRLHGEKIVCVYRNGVRLYKYVGEKEWRYGLLPGEPP